MTNYPRSAYTNLLSGVNVNAIPAGWGSYQYPNGVPNSLLGTVHFDFGVTRLSVTMRRELTVLCGLSLQIAKKHGYVVYGSPNPSGESTWGPWGYENRTISGSNTPSNHSKGRAWDWNAPWNPYTTPIVSTIPPALVTDMQRIGWYWGGFYGDSMHFEYVKPLDQVPAMENLARQILGQTGGGGGGGPIPSGPGHVTPFPLGAGHWIGVGDYESGPLVAQVQRRLASRGYAVGAIDGEVGPKFVAAVKKAQSRAPKSLHLAVDGDVGPATWKWFKA